MGFIDGADVGADETSYMGLIDGADVGKDEASSEGLGVEIQVPLQQFAGARHQTVIIAPGCISQQERSWLKLLAPTNIAFYIIQK